MVFSSITFLIYFMPITICVYYLAPAQLKNTVLLAASLFFYAWGEPVYILLMLFSIALNYIAGIILGRTVHKNVTLAVSVCFNIALLGFFKYADFAVSCVNSVLGISPEPFNLPLPVGISFYTFQAISYLADVYKGDVKVQKNIIDFAMYISMFPQLIAGPIIRLADIEDSLHRRSHSSEKFAAGARRFTSGLAKKALLANGAGLIWDSVNEMPNGDMSAASAWIGIIGFTFQIYFDFSGYSDMAIGLGKMLGFDFPENFRYPYTSRSVTEFWRRWHISLGTWFREYVYIPLGGSRCGAAARARNILAVWLLTGLWHGASGNFVMWGLYFAVLLMTEKAFLLRRLEKLPSMAGYVYTMIAVIISWVIFALGTTGEIISYIKAMFGIGAAGFFDSTAAYLIGSNAVLFVILAVGCTEVPAYAFRRMSEVLSGGKGREAAGVIIENVCLAAILVISLAYVESDAYNPFLYFRF